MPRKALIAAVLGNPCMQVTSGGMLPCTHQSSPPGFQHEGSAKRLHGGLQVGRAADAAEVCGWDAGAVEVLLLQELVLQQPEPSATLHSRLL